MRRARKNRTVYELAALVAVVFIFLLGAFPAQKNVFVNFPESGVSLTAEVADAPYAREKGLMFVKSLPENSGMLFIFDYPQELRFWMKNTLIPLDIIFVSENFTVVNVAENAQPCSDYCPLYYSASPSKYVVETNAGFVKNNGINVGDEVRILE